VSTRHLRGCLTAYAALAFLWAQTARGDVADGGAPRDAAVADAAAAGTDASAPAPVPAPVPGELAMPPDLVAPTTSAQVTMTETPLVDTPAATQAEPPRPITRRLWFWLAIAGVVVGAAAIAIAVQSPSVSRPDCPAGYVCPL